MSHLDHDRLVFLALGELTVGADDAHHLDSCATCRGEFESLRHVAGLGADTQGLGDLPAPPEQVWQNIAAQVAAAQALPSLTEVRQKRDSKDVPVPQWDTAGDVPVRLLAVDDVPELRREADEAPVRPARRRGGRRGRIGGWAVTAATAAAAAALGVVGTVAALRPYAPEPPEPSPTVVARAPLSAYGSTPASASGSARVLKDGQLHLHVSNLPRVPGYYEVWLISPTDMQMFSVGVLGDRADALLPLPPNVDLSRYRVVDVSAEGYDNNQAHSGDSLLRGTLTS